MVIVDLIGVMKDLIEFVFLFITFFVVVVFVLFERKMCRGIFKGEKKDVN